MAQCLPFTGIAHQNNQTLYGQNNQTVVRLTTTSEAKSDKNRRNRQNARYFPGIPGFSQVYPQNTRYFASLAEFGRKPASDPENLMIPRSFVIYHTTLCSYHTTPLENQISGKYHSFTSKWPSLIRVIRRIHTFTLSHHTHTVMVISHVQCVRSRRALPDVRERPHLGAS